jgi:uncharacterized membrane protein
VFLKSILVIVTIAYPFIIYFGLAHFDSTSVMFLIITLLVIRGIIEKQQNTRKVIFTAAFGVLVVAYFWGDQQGLKLYPVLVNASMLLLFASSLYAKQSIIERMARFKEPNLPESGVRYTRKVTIIWCVFFALNGLAALFTTFWASDKVWVFYNGILAYVLIAIMIVAEWVVRLKVKHKV